MCIPFRVFRKLLLGTIIFLHATSLVLALYLKPSFPHPNSVYVIVGILDTLIFASILSVFRRPIFTSPQTVATETLGLFILLPFASIMLLYTLSLSVTPQPTPLWIFAVLQLLLMISTGIHGLYTIGLVGTAMLTVCAFDRDVWTRDIDTSPSPFPMSVLLYFICPCFSPNSGGLNVTDHTVPEQHEGLCVPGCNCSTGKTPLTETEPTPSMRMASSSRSLIRIPNDRERRTSIVVAFEV